jgi:glycosyltransferase involved in cell wall biosynthesis
MRIAYDHQIFSLQSYGGISRYFTRLAGELLKIGEQVKVFSPTHRNNHLLDLSADSVIGSYIRRYPPATGRIFFHTSRLLSFGKMKSWKPDVVHETYYSSKAIVRSDCPTITTIHDMIQELIPNDFSSRDNVARNKTLAVERADHVICVSENTRRDLIRLTGISEKKTSVVHHGFDQFSQVKPHAESSPEGQKPYFLYVGNRGGYKNFAKLLIALATSKRLMRDFDVVAFGGPAFLASEISLMKSLGFSERQVHHRIGSDDVLGTLYRGALAFIYPSRYEGFGIPPLEAMAHECPVICSNSSSLPEVIGDAGEYFAPDDVDDMRRAIEMVAYSDQVRACLRLAGLARIKKFSWEKCARETLDVYRNVL